MLPSSLPAQSHGIAGCTASKGLGHLPGTAPALDKPELRSGDVHGLPDSTKGKTEAYGGGGGCRLIQSHQPFPQAQWLAETTSEGGLGDHCSTASVSWGKVEGEGQVSPTEEAPWL